jgi:futalosine hydrolase
MTILVACATRTELRAVLSALSPAKTRLPEGGAGAHEVFVPVPGGGRPVLALCAGVGPAAAAATLGRALAGRHDGAGVAGVVQIGVAGSFDLEAAPMGGVWAVTREIWPEYGLVTAEGTAPRGIGLPMVETEAGPVYETLELRPDDAAAAMGLVLPGSLGRAASLTVAGATGTMERAALLFRRHGALLENMEGFAAALACRLARVPFVQIRAVSNLVGSRRPEHWDLKGALSRLGPTLAELFRSAA